MANAFTVPTSKIVWDIADGESESVHDIVVQDGCTQLTIPKDGWYQMIHGDVVIEGYFYKGSILNIYKR